MGSLSRHLFFATISSGFCAASSGFAFGYSSAAAFQIFLNVTWSSVFASCLNIGGLFGSLSSGYFLSRCGRRWTMIAGCVPGIIGWIWLGMSYEGVYERYAPTALFICGRILTGVSAGMTIPASASYLAEIAPPEWYNVFGILTQLGIVCGIAMAYLLGALLPWELAAVFDGIFMIVILICIMCLPESPRWLLKNGQVQQANAAQIWLHGSLAQSLTTSDVKANEEGGINDPVAQHTFVDHLLPCRAIPRSQYPRLRVTLLLMIFQQLTGINAILYFAESICLFGGLSWAATCALILGIFQIIFTVIAAPIVHRSPRKKVLMWTALVMCAAHFAHGLLTFRIQYGTPSILLHIGVIACVVVFLFGFSVGWGPLPVLLTIDLFPTATRGFAVSAVVAINWVASFVVTAMFEPLTSYIGSAVVFWIFSFFCALAYMFTRRYVPESIPTDIY